MKNQKSIKVVIACGGTGGHLFPGLAVAQVLRDRGHELLLLVSEKEIDTTALRAHPEFRAEKLPSIGMPSAALSPAFIRFLRRAWESLSLCRTIYRRFQPDVVLGMGGFTSTAPILAARWRRLPAFIHESNAIPGRANRFAARFATSVLLGFEECARLFPDAHCEVTGTPVRQNLGSPIPAAEARRAFNLDPETPTLLVTGGSQGASGINQILFKCAPLLAGRRLQVIHLTGERDDRLAAANYQRDQIPHYVAPFHHRMEEAYSAADLVVSRAGASSLSEISQFGLPSVLIPYPYATDDHQAANARIYQAGGAAEVFMEKETVPETFSILLTNLLEDAPRRERMSLAARRIPPARAAENVATVIEKAAREARP